MENFDQTIPCNSSQDDSSFETTDEEFQLVLEDIFCDDLSAFYDYSDSTLDDL